MAEEKFLQGKVIKYRLAVVDPSAPNKPALKRLMLPQGELSQFYDAEEGIRYIAYIELRPGAERGNHYHKAKEEYIYVIKGGVELFVEEIQTGEKAMIPMVSGDLAFIRPEIAHALRTTEPGSALEFSPVRFDPADTHRFALEPKK